MGKIIHLQAVWGDPLRPVDSLDNLHGRGFVPVGKEEFISKFTTRYRFTLVFLCSNLS